MQTLKRIITISIMITGIIFITSFFQLHDMWDAPKSANLRKNPFKGNLAATQKGKALFQSQCVYCHGSKGKGNGPSGVDLKPSPTDLTAKMTQERSTQSRP